VTPAIAAAHAAAAASHNHPGLAVVGLVLILIGLLGGRKK
jgi:hypothetical protein